MTCQGTKLITHENDLEKPVYTEIHVNFTHYACDYDTFLLQIKKRTEISWYQTTIQKLEKERTKSIAKICIGTASAIKYMYVYKNGGIHNRFQAPNNKFLKRSMSVN